MFIFVRSIRVSHIFPAALIALSDLTVVVVEIPWGPDVVPRLFLVGANDGHKLFIT
jgi:hypothetical protein